MDKASALETQKVFRQIVEDSIINYDTSTWINNMNQAISSTNVVLNTAISPTLWLIPSSLIILKNPIDGYNNKLKVSNKNMVFGINKNLNYYWSKTRETAPVIARSAQSSEAAKKQHNIELKKLEKLDDSERSEQVRQKPSVHSKKPVRDTKNFSSKAVTTTTPTTDNLIVLSLSIIGGILLSKYIF